MKNTVRINFEFPKEEHPYLKMMCSLKNTSVKEFASKLLLQAIEDFEDERLTDMAEKALKDDEWVTEEDVWKKHII